MFARAVLRADIARPPQANKASRMFHEVPAAVPPPGRPMSPYPAVWRRHFAGLDPNRSVPATIWCDRGSESPLAISTRIPLCPSPQEKRLAGLHVAALLNNALCIHGAASASIVSPRQDAAAWLCDAVLRLLMLPREPFSTMPLDFLHELVRQVFRQDFRLDADPAREALLREKQLAAPATRADQPAPPRPGLALAVNIGLYLTSLALVRVEADGRFVVEGLSRRKSAPENKVPSLADLLATIRDEAKALAAAAGAALDAVGIGIAATVVRGRILPVPGYGLFTEDASDTPETVAALLQGFSRDVARGRPLAVVNDGQAQAVFAYRHGGATPSPPARLAGDMVSVRLGACPAVHRLDSCGRSAAGFHEYGWCVTRYHAANATRGCFTTIHPYLSYAGVAIVAQELGLLRKRRIPHEAATAFFRDALEADDPGLRQKAAHVYGILGAHLAMLADALQRDRPLAVIRLLGSRANRLDPVAFAAMVDGFAAFASRHDLGLRDVELTLLQETSVIAGLVGAAHAALDAVPQPEGR